MAIVREIGNNHIKIVLVKKYILILELEYYTQLASKEIKRCT